MDTDSHRRIQIDPAPTADEAAAIVTALSAYLAGQRASQPPPAPPERRWALAGRLASQGQSFARLPGIRTGWGNVARLARIVGQ